jgi:hypothetical protein
LRSSTARPASLRPFARNARTHSAEQIAEIAASIKRFGWTNPCLIDEEGEIIAGHGRVEAATLAGHEQIPTITLPGLSQAEKRALVIADNQIPLNAGWNEDLLRGELLELRGLGEANEIDFGLGLLGFSDAALEALLGEGKPKPETGSLADTFMVAPFSVLNAREGWWQERKRAWLALGIESECGRGENLLKMSDTILEPDPSKRPENQKARNRVPAYPRGRRSIPRGKLESSVALGQSAAPPARSRRRRPIAIRISIRRSALGKL